MKTSKMNQQDIDKRHYIATQAQFTEYTRAIAVRELADNLNIEHKELSNADVIGLYLHTSWIS